MLACSIGRCQISIYYVINELNNVRKNINTLLLITIDLSVCLWTVLSIAFWLPIQIKKQIKFTYPSSPLSLEFESFPIPISQWLGNSTFFCENMLFSSSSSSCCWFRAIKGFVVVGGLFFFCCKKTNYFPCNQESLNQMKIPHRIKMLENLYLEKQPIRKWKVSTFLLKINIKHHRYDEAKRNETKRSETKSHSGKLPWIIKFSQQQYSNSIAFSFANRKRKF